MAPRTDMSTDFGGILDSGCEPRAALVARAPRVPAFGRFIREVGREVNEIAARSRGRRRLLRGNRESCRFQLIAWPVRRGDRNRIAVSWRRKRHMFYSSNSIRHAVIAAYSRLPRGNHVLDGSIGQIAGCALSVAIAIAPCFSPVRTMVWRKFEARQ